jgi:NADPH:quinone reductase-like Zn-dependent oxidoreductase
MALVKNLGADEVLDYKTPEGLRYHSPSGRTYDVVVHLAPYQPLEAFKAELAPKGMVIDMTPTLKTIARDWYNRLTFAKHKFVPFVMTANVADLQEVIDLMEAGKLKVIVDSTYPLEKSADAWACSIRGHATGKVVVTCNN